MRKNLPQFKKKLVKLKAILFDFDGTLVHSVSVLVSLFEEVLAEQNFPPADPKKIRRLIGEPLDQIFRKLTNLDNIEYLSESFHAKENARHTAEHIQLMKEVIPTLEFLKSQNLKLGIVSTKQRELVKPLSAELKIGKFFDVMVGGWDVKNPKPHPEPILLACKKLEIKPREIIFVGDSLLDLQSAKSAEAIFVGVLTGVCSREEFKKARADYIFSHVGEMVNLVRRVLNSK